MNFQSGAFGNPQEINTLILFWTKMSTLHYPGAEDTLSYLKEMLQQQIEMQRAQMAQQAAIAEQQRRAQAEQFARQQQMQQNAIIAARNDARRDAMANMAKGGQANGTV